MTPTGFSFVKDPTLGGPARRRVSKGDVSFHGSGIHPGFAGDRLPLVLSALCRRIDKITVYEVCDLSQGSESPEMVMQQLGFGMSAEDAGEGAAGADGRHEHGSSTSRWTWSQRGWASTLDGYDHRHEFAVAKRDVQVHAGVIKRGHVAGQHFEYTGLVRGKPVIQFNTYWKMSKEIEPSWPYDAPIEYTVEIEGDPSVRCSLCADRIGHDRARPRLDRHELRQRIRRRLRRAAGHPDFPRSADSARGGSLPASGLRRTA